MVQIISPLLASLAIVHTAAGSPLVKRIAQVISDSTKQWEAACDAAGGGQQCNPVAVNAFGTLLAAAGACDQQNAADQMIDLAKQLNNDPNMIKFAQIFAQQPRNSPTSLSVPYCQSAPKNSELNGLFQCQFQGTNPTVFVGNLQVGAAGTIPFGLNAPLSPPQSCPAHTSGGITDGTQLVDLVQDPGVVGGSGSSSGSSSSGSSDSSSQTSSSSSGDNSGSSDSGSSSSSSDSGSSDSGSSSDSSSSDTSSSSGSSFALSNGQAAQALNAQFASLSTSDSCTDGQNACISSQFAKCDHGSWVTFDCGSANGLICAALPLVNSAGTSVTCTTMSDALARISATGAQGGFTGSN